MTELQKAEFEMLKELVSICNKLGLTYYLVCGSALGAVKYNGFIPWDDDLDVALLRPDYEMFCEKAQSLLPAHLFLQNYASDPRYPLLYSKIRNSNTTFVESSVGWLDINHGVYIDVFPIDGYPLTKVEQFVLENRKFLLKFQSLATIKPNPGMKPLTRFLLKTERVLGYHRRTAKIMERLTTLLTAYSPESSAVWCNHGNWQGKLEYAPREQYGNGTWTTFEGLKVRIPEKYDEYLTQKYGDWRADLPEEQKVGHHYAEIIDLTRPYTDYIEKLSHGKIRIKKPEELS